MFGRLTFNATRATMTTMGRCKISSYTRILDRLRNVEETNNKIKEKHNELLKEHNELLKKHNELLKKHDELSMKRDELLKIVQLIFVREFAKVVLRKL